MKKPCCGRQRDEFKNAMEQKKALIAKNTPPIPTTTTTTTLPKPKSLEEVLRLREAARNARIAARNARIAARNARIKNN
jgi:hypothetical protein